MSLIFDWPSAETKHIISNYVINLFPVMDFEFPENLYSVVDGVSYRSPIGMAGGFDKNARYLRLPHVFGLGFGEIGSVTLHPNKGNKRPRMFVLSKDRSIINRMGLPSDGVRVIKNRLFRWAHKEVKNIDPKRIRPIGTYRVPIGINVGYAYQTTKESAIRTMDILSEYGSYITLNISSPNSYTSMRFYPMDFIHEFFDYYNTYEGHSLRVKKPIYVKLSPDTNDETLRNTFEVLKKYAHNEVKGVIVGNSSRFRSPHLVSRNRQESGAYSGHILLPRTLEMVKMARKCLGPDYTVIACGGINSAFDVWRCMSLGANLVQMYTCLFLKTPEDFKLMTRSLSHMVKSAGYKNIAEVVGRSL